MKRAPLLLLCLLPCLASTASATAWAQEPTSGQTFQTEPFPLYKVTLANGLRVWCQPRPDSESVAALLVVGAGARNETPANNGASHFVEHMLFTGTERWSEEEIKEVIRRRGGRWNGWTGSEQTTYFAHIAAGDFAVALDWLAQVVFHPTFPAGKVDKEREIIFQERWGHYGWLINTLDALGFGYELDRDVRRALFPGSTLGLRVVGEDASLESLDRAALMEYYRARYTPGNAVLIVVGNVTPEQAFEQAQIYLGDLAGRDERPALPDTPAPLTGGPHQVTVRGPLPTDQMSLMVGARTVGRVHPDQWALQVLAEVLGNDLQEEIRYQQGLVYGLGAYQASFDDAGYFAIATNSEQSHQQAILDAIERHLEQMRRGDVDAGKVAQAQAALKGRWALAMEDNVERAMWLAQWASVLAAGQPVPDYPATIDAVSPADLARVTAAYFTPERRYLGLHQPVMTVASGARAAGIGLALALGAWAARRVWRWARARRGA